MLGAVLSMMSALRTVFTARSSPTFYEAIKLAADNTKDLARSASMALPKLKALNREIPVTAHSAQTIAAAKTTGALRMGAAMGGSVRMMESSEMKDVLSRIPAALEHYAKRVESAALKDTVLKINDREFGRAAKHAVNKEMRLR